MGITRVERLQPLAVERGQRNIPRTAVDGRSFSVRFQIDHSFGLIPTSSYLGQSV